MQKKKYNVTLWILIGLVLGIVVGFIMPDWLETPFGVVSSLYMSALTMMIYPLVFVSLVCGIMDIGSISKTGKIGGQTLLYFIGTTLFASLLGIFLPMILGVGKGVEITMQEAAVEATKFGSLLDTVKGLIPSNPVKAFAEGNMLQVLVFSLIIGIVCLILGKKSEPFVNVCRSLNDICIKIVQLVMYVTPIGVFVSIANVVHSNGIKTIASVGVVMLIIYIVYVLYAVVVYGLGVVKGIGRYSFRKFWKLVAPAALNAFGTCSSNATIPISKKCCDDMGVPGEISSLAIPLGATINMDAVSILMSFMIVYFCNATGTPINIGGMVVVMLANTLLSIGTPGVPGGAIASFAALSAMVGLNPGIMTLYISVNTLADMGATCVNVLGDVATSVAMTRTCKLEDGKQDAAK